MTPQLDVAIIGAGPYGLSIAAHLRGAGVDHRIFGTPMDFWQCHMPPGMLLKSDGAGSDLSDPEGRLTLAAFCREQGIDHHPNLLPVALETFVAYGIAFQARVAPRVEAKRLVALTGTGVGHRLDFDDGESVSVRHVIMATGVLPFAHIPDELAHLPAELASHSSNYGPLDALEGREVVIVGGGSSGLDFAALLHERGSPVTVVARTARPNIHTPPLAHLSRLRRLRYPSSRIGGGWLLRICDDAPQLIHLLPEQQRLALVRNTLGPSGGYFIRDRVVGRVPLKYGRIVERAEERGGRVVLHTVGRGGTREAIAGDHVLMATGYRVDLDRLAVLAAEVRARIRMVQQTPVLSANFESSVPGLYFVGTASANSFGPVMRFAIGAVHPARRLARHLRKALVRRLVAVPAVATG
jgi:thioredoxin reductase